MQRTVSDETARQRLTELLDGVFERGDEVIIERAGTPVGVVIPPERYASIRASRERLRELIDEVREDNQGVDPDQVGRDVEAAVEALRRGKAATPAPSGARANDQA
jgi:prevent-host-death family protein